jgi:hypothetical protein
MVLSVRGGTANLINRFGMAFASLALVAWYLSATVFVPGRADAVAQALLDSAHVQQTTSQQLFTQLRSLTAKAAGLSPQVTDAVTAAMAKDPQLRAALAAHGLAGAGARPVGPLDVKPVDAAMHRALGTVDPALAADLATVHLRVTPLGVGYSVDAVPQWDQAARVANHVWPLAAGVAAGFFVLALLVAGGGGARGVVVRRGGRWMVVAAGVQLALVVVLPWALARYTTGMWSARAPALAALWGQDILVPLLGLFGAGIAFVLIGSAWQDAAATSRGDRRG